MHRSPHFLRRFSLRAPIAWLAGFHVAAPLALVAALVSFAVFSPVMGELTLRARREFVGLWIFGSAFAPLLLLARMHLLLRDTALTRVQKLKLFGASTGMVALFGAQLLAVVLGERVYQFRMGTVHRMDLVDMLAPLSFGLCAGITLAALGILYHQTSRARTLLNASVFMLVAGMMSAGFMSGVLIRHSQFGLLGCSMLMLIPGTYALLGPDHARVFGANVGRADAAMFGIVPFYVGATICVGFSVDGLVGSYSMSHALQWGLGGTMLVVLLFGSFSMMIWRLGSRRLVWGNE